MTRFVRVIRIRRTGAMVAIALVVSIVGAASTVRRRDGVDLGAKTRSRASEHVPADSLDLSGGEEGGVVREPMAWGCSADIVATTVAHDRATARTPIPPPALLQDVSDLRVGRAFPARTRYNLAISPEQVPAVEQEFCKRDAELVCPSPAERQRLVADVLQRTARIAARSTAASAEGKAAQRVGAELREGRIPVILFNTTMRHGPTAGIIRFQEGRTGKWILGIAFAKDFVSSGENSLFLDGVMVQEMVHYDDLSVLPDPLRCYESNIEIRGHYAMLRYWTRQRRAGVAEHPRIKLVMRAGLAATSRRSKWYTYLNRVEKTDFLVEDELVSLEFRSLAALSPDRAEDARFLHELSSVVSSALGKATYMRSHVESLPADAINAHSRVISAVSRLMPRLLRRYERARADLKEPDGTPRPAAMANELGDIHRSLAAIEKLKVVLAADPDFRRKSEFVGPD